MKNSSCFNDHKNDHGWSSLQWHFSKFGQKICPPANSKLSVATSQGIKVTRCGQSWGNCLWGCSNQMTKKLKGNDSEFFLMTCKTEHWIVHIWCFCHNKFQFPDLSANKCATMEISVHSCHVMFVNGWTQEGLNQRGDSNKVHSDHSILCHHDLPGDFAENCETCKEFVAGHLLVLFCPRKFSVNEQWPNDNKCWPHTTSTLVLLMNSGRQ